MKYLVFPLFVFALVFIIMQAHSVWMNVKSAKFVGKNIFYAMVAAVITTIIVGVIVIFFN